MTHEELALSNQQLRAEIAKLNAEIAKLHAEARSIGVSTFLAPFLAAAGLMGATAAVVKIFFP